jgi:hypothetical protein
MVKYIWVFHNSSFALRYFVMQMARLQCDTSSLVLPFLCSQEQAQSRWRRNYSQMSVTSPEGGQLMIMVPSPWWALKEVICFTQHCHCPCCKSPQLWQWWSKAENLVGSHWLHEEQSFPSPKLMDLLGRDVYSMVATSQ